MDEQTLSFQEKSYKKSDLETMSDEDLLTLRNEVATALSVNTIKSFKDHVQAVDQTWKALERFTTKSAPKPEKPAKAPKPPKEPKERKPAKSSMPGIVKRPTQKMFATIRKIGEHDGSTHGRAHRWPNYKDGMTFVDVIEGDGTEAWDVYNWVSKGIMAIDEATDEQYAARRAAWYAKHNLVDPELSKEEKAAAAAAAKEAREKAAAEKRAAKAAEAAAKAAAAATPAAAE